MGSGRVYRPRLQIATLAPEVQLCQLASDLLVLATSETVGADVYAEQETEREGEGDKRSIPASSELASHPVSFRPGEWSLHS